MKSRSLGLLICAVALYFVTGCGKWNCTTNDLQDAIYGVPNLTQRGIAINVLYADDTMAQLEVRTGFSRSTLETISKEHKLDAVSRNDSSVKVLSDLEANLKKEYGFKTVEWWVPSDAYTPPESGNTGRSTGQKSFGSTQCNVSGSSITSTAMLFGIIFAGMAVALAYSIFLNIRKPKDDGVSDGGLNL